MDNDGYEYLIQQQKECGITEDRADFPEEGGGNICDFCWEVIKKIKKGKSIESAANEVFEEREAKRNLGLER